MKRFIFTALLCIGLLAITSCSFKKSEPAKVIPLDEGTRTTSPKSSGTGAPQKTTTKKTVYRKKASTKKVVKTVTKKIPHSDFQGAYPQIIYNNLAVGAYGNIPSFNPPNHPFFPYQHSVYIAPGPQPVMLTTWDEIARHNQRGY